MATPNNSRDTKPYPPSRLPNKLLEKTFSDFLRNSVLLLIAALFGALAVILFLVPSGIAPGGVSGIAIILNDLINTPVGLMTLVLNVPLWVLGYYFLGGWRVIANTIIYVLLFSLFVDLLTPLIPPDVISDNDLLNAIYSGIFSGISGGITFRMGATVGGTAILVRILGVKLGLPVATASLYVDGIIVLASGFVFGFEAVLLAAISIVIYGLVSDYVLEGPSVIRTATIITSRPQMVSDVVLYNLARGVTGWEARGMYTQEARHVLFVSILRTEVFQLRDLVASVDPEAFVVIGQGHVAYGEGFRRVQKPRPKGASAKASKGVSDS